MKLQLSVSPHIKENITTPNIMWSVVLALLPAVAFSLYLFKIPALIVLSSSVITAILTESIITSLQKKTITILDGSAVITGLLLAMTLPPATPWWVVSLGSFFAIAIVKLTFGGLGMNIFNPALAGRAFLLASYPVILTTWSNPLDLKTTATPLAVLGKLGITQAQNIFSHADSFWGMIPGSLGETSAFALLIGAIFLLIRKIIDWRIPLAYIGTVTVLSGILGQDILFHVLNGGLILGAFFMATDYVTSPLTSLGRIVFGVGAGILVVVIRLWGGYPEGVCYSILLMNAITPFLDKLKLRPDYYIAK